MTSTSRSPFFGWLAIACTAYYVLVVVALHVLVPSFDPRSKFISDYVNTPYGWLATTTFVAFAAGLVALARGLWPILPPRRMVPIGLWSLIIGAAGIVGAGIFPADPVDPPESTIGKLHILVGLAGYFALTVAMVALSVGLRHAPAWRGNARLPVPLTILFVLVFLTTIVVLGDRGFAGVGQRLFLAVQFAWLMRDPLGGLA